jgi:hypothetical protein
MKCMYMNYVVEITTTCKDYHVDITRFDNPYGADLTPIVEIATQYGLQRVLATTEFFPTAEQAQQHGMGLAQKWIEGHLFLEVQTLERRVLGPKQL